MPARVPTHRNIDLRLDLTPQQRGQWTALKAIFSAHMKKINRVYRKATPSQQAQIRAHCPTLDDILKLVEEME